MKNALISMYGKCGSLEDAHQIFQQMRTNQRNQITWNAMISAYGQHGQAKEVFKLFEMMKQEGIEPDEFTWIILMTACANVGAFELGKKLHQELVECGIKMSVDMKNALISMYGKCGSLEDAHQIFQQMRTNQRDQITWNAMISAYGQHGQVKEAFRLFHEMQNEGITPDGVTFSAVLNACSHGGFVEEALACFDSMKSRFNVTPSVMHQTSVVDVLGRAKRLDEAEEFIRKMDKPDVVTWTTLLGACRVHGDLERAKRVAESGLRLDPQCSSIYVLLSNIYQAAGHFTDAEQVRNMMKENQVKKIPGQSWIEIDGQVHSFVVNDQTHPRTPDIYSELESLSAEMTQAGYVPDMSFVLHDIKDEEKEHLLCSHSEKLAIAFGLISTLPGSCLVIVKNLRLCGDCHSSTKFISKIRHREIIVRDAHRFHHFKDGECSCQDYF